MDFVYTIVGLIALALLAYLVVALMKPEWFG
jgi:K+-transporting ATPase KdpF subunit